MEHNEQKKIAQHVGWAMLFSLVIGILSALFVVQGIDINLSADIKATAANMLEAETQLRAKAYIAAFLMIFEVLIAYGMFMLLRQKGPLLAAVSLIVGLATSILSLDGAVFALNAAEIGSNSAYTTMTDDGQRLMLAGLQATSDYTSFHLALILSSISKAGFFYLFFTSHMLPKIISGWGIFASLFVAITIVARDFIPMLGHGNITAAFMVSNLIAIVSTGLYMSIKGIRESSS